MHNLLYYSCIEKFFKNLSQNYLSKIGFGFL